MLFVLYIPTLNTGFLLYSWMFQYKFQSSWFWEYDLQQVSAGWVKGLALDPNQRWPLQWRHNEHDGASNHQPYDCLLNRLFRRRSKKTSNLRATGLCDGNSPLTGEFPSQWASNTEMFPFDDVIRTQFTDAVHAIVQLMALYRPSNMMNQFTNVDMRREVSLRRQWHQHMYFYNPLPPQRKCQSPIPLTLLWGRICRWSLDSPHKGPVMKFRHYKVYFLSNTEILIRGIISVEIQYLCKQVRCDLAFIVPLHRNKPNIGHLLSNTHNRHTTTRQWGQHVTSLLRVQSMSCLPSAFQDPLGNIVIYHTLTRPAYTKHRKDD